MSEPATEVGTPAPSPTQSAEDVLLAHRFPVLDSLRAVGALAVVTTHAAFWAGSYSTQGLLGTVSARLDVGVAIFFVLSGFLLARPYLVRAARGEPRPSTGRYLWKRLLRIAPVYVITVVLALTFIDQDEPLGVGDWVLTLLMGNTFVEDRLPDGLTQMWSLAVEVSFYLVLPLLLRLALGRARVLHAGRVVVLVVAMAAVTVWWRVSGAHVVGWPGEPEQWLPAYLVWFAVGILLALLQVQHARGLWLRATRPLMALGRQPGSCWAVAAGLLLVAATPIAGATMLGPTTPSQGLVKALLYAAIGGLLVLTGIAGGPETGYSRALGARAPRHLGFISYGLFCLHLPVLHLVMWVTGWPLFEGRFVLIWALACGISLVAAEASYRLVEAPAMRLKSWRGPSSRPVHAETSGTSTR